MTEAMLQLQSGFDERMSELGQRFRLPRTGDEFDAILLPLPPIDPMFELGTDKREKASLEGRRDRLPAIVRDDIILQLQPFWTTEPLAAPPKWMALEREDNPANFAVKYTLVKVTEGDANF
jgi:hypothetical protein